MHKLELDLEVHAATRTYQTDLRIFNQRSWRAGLGAVRAGCFGCHSRSSYVLDGVWKPDRSLGWFTGVPNSLRVRVTGFAVDEVYVTIAGVDGEGETMIWPHLFLNTRSSDMFHTILDGIEVFCTDVGKASPRLWEIIRFHKLGDFFEELNETRLNSK